MSDKPPTKARVLTRLRIDEVSAVDKGAGKGVKIMLMKRADAADDHVDLSPAEIARAKIEGYQALRHAEERFLKEEGAGYADHTPEDDPSRFYFNKDTFRRKSPRGVMRSAAKKCDDGLAMLTEGAKEIRTAIAQTNARGLGNPSATQLQSLGERAVLAAMIEMPWARAFQHLAPGQRQTFAGGAGPALSRV
jgi:hypothetical protein